MASLGITVVLLSAVGCALALALSIYPGWLHDLVLYALLAGVFAAPIVVVAAAVLTFAAYRRGFLRVPQMSWKHAAIVLVMLMVTFAALRLYIPRRLAFAAVRSSFQKIVDDGATDDREFDRRIGPYFVDDCLVDERGGTYFRVYAGADGIGPDTMSYGFCYNPNREGSPFGAADYQTFRLGDGWYWFRASDDSF